MNIYIAQKQAQQVAQLMQLDYELAAATVDIKSLSHFLGYYYTREWPVHVSSLFNQGADEHFNIQQLFRKSTGKLSVDGQGCIKAPLILKPCWSVQEGIRVEVRLSLHKADHVIVRPRVLTSGSLTLLGLGMDAIMVQNHYFQQTTAWSDTSLEASDQAVRSQQRRQRR